jgi:hypothetical protein
VGRTVIIPILGANGEVDVVFDGARAKVVGPLPFDFTWRAIAADGSTWGIGPHGTLLVLPASETDG